MALTDSEAAELASLNQKYGPLGSAQTTVQPESLGVRILKTVGNLPVAADQDILHGAVNLLNLGVPDDARLAAPELAKPFTIAPPAANDYAGMAVDTVGGVAAALPSFLIPEAGIGKLGEAVGLGGKLLGVAKSAGAAAINTADQGPAATAEQAGLLGALSLTGGMGRLARLPYTIGAGAVAGGLSYANGQSGAASLIQGGIFTALGQIPGAHPNDVIPATRTAEKMLPAQPVDSLLPGTEAPYGPRNVGNPLPDLVPTPDGSVAPTPGLRLDDGSQQQMNFTPPADVTSQPTFRLDGADHPELPLSGSPVPVRDPSATLAPQPQGELPWFGKDSSRQVGPQKSAAESAQAILDLQAQQRVSDAAAARNNVGPMKSAQDSAEAIMANKVPLRPNTPLPADAPSLVGKAAQNLGIRYDGMEPDEAVTHPIFGKMRDAQHQFTLLDEGKETTFNLPENATYSDLKAKTAEVRQSMSGDIINGDEPDVTSQSVQPTFPDGHPDNKLLLEKPADQDQILSTAVNPGDGRVLVGGRWDEPHEGVGMRHDIDDVPQTHRGFLVHNSDGTQSFMHRGDALEVARRSGQLRNPDQTTPLNSTDLKRTASEKGGGDAPQSATKPVSPEPPPEPAARQEPSLKASAALSGESASKSEPWYMSSDLSHLNESDREDAEYIRGSIRRQLTPGDEHNPEGAVYAANQLKELIGTGAPGAPQVVKNVTSQPPPQAASWLFGDDEPTAKTKRTYSSRDEWLNDDIGLTDDDVEERSGAHAGELTNELGTQANDYEVEDDKVGASEYGTDTEDADDLQSILQEEQEDQTAIKNEAEATAPKISAEEDASEQISDEDRKEFAELTDDAPKSSTDETATEQTDKLMGLMDMLEKRPKSPALQRSVRRRTGLTARRKGTAGFIDATVVRDALGILAIHSPGIIAGGSIGAYYDDENRLRGFLIGAMLGLGGQAGLQAGFIKMMMREVPRIAKEQTQIVKNVTSQPGAELMDVLENLAAEDNGATSQGIAEYARRFSKELTRTDDARTAVGISNLSGLRDEATKAIKLATEFYPRLSLSERAIYEKYQSEPWFVPDPVTGKQVPNVGVETKFTSDMSAHPEFTAGAMSARRLRVVEQQLIANSLPDGALQKTVLDSIGKYHTDAFRIFMESRYKPTQSQVDGFIKELNYTKVFPGYDEPMLRKTLQSQLDEIYKNRQLFTGTGGGGDTGTLDKILKAKITMPEQLEKDLLAAVPGAKSVDEIVTSQATLPKELSAKLAEAIKDGTYLTPAYRDLLGYYRDPLERELATHVKLVPAARAASMFDQVANGHDTKSGLPMSLDPNDAVTLRAQLQAQRAVIKDPVKLKEIDVKLLDLKNRVMLPPSPNLGILAGRYVPQGMADVLPNMDKAAGGQAMPLTRGIMDGTRVIKAGQTILNPVSHLHQLYSAPVMSMISGTSFASLRAGIRVAAGKGDFMGVPSEIVSTRMKALNIQDTNIAHSEFNTTSRMALTGFMDSSIADKLFAHPVVAYVAEKYALWDNGVRIGTFLQREQAMLKRYAPDVALNKMPDSLPEWLKTSGRTPKEAADYAAEQEAIRYTNRYTVNFEGVPGGVAYIRKMPFVSLYLTYGYEVARITKNLMVDAIGKGPYGKEAQFGAIKKLAMLSVVPYAMQQAGRAMLSDDDKKAWDESNKLDQPYAQPRYKIPLYRNANGLFKYVDITPYVPTGDWNMFGRAVASGDWKQILAVNPIFGTSNTPALNVANEIITGLDSRTGRPINTLGRAFDAARQELAPPVLGGFEFDNLMRALQPNDSGGLGITRLGSGKGQSISDLLVTYTTGLRPTNVNVDWQKHTAVQDATAQIATERQFLMDTARSDATQDVKDAAIKRYADAVKMIVAHLQTRLGMENN